jgi:hypothetical protein
MNTRLIVPDIHALQRLATRPSWLDSPEPADPHEVSHLVVEPLDLRNRSPEGVLMRGASVSVVNPLLLTVQRHHL